MDYKLNSTAAKAKSLYARASKIVTLFTLSFRLLSCKGMDDFPWVLEF